MSETITHGEWLSAFETALKSRPVGDEGMSAMEIAHAIGRSTGFTIKRLGDLKRAGKLVVGESWRENLAGRTIRIPVYRIVR
jgi:hypothetical protein